MRMRRRLEAAAVACLVAALAVSGSAQKKDDKTGQRKLDKAEQKDLDSLFAAVDGVVAGQPAPAGIDVTWAQSHFLKAQAGKAYVPFTLSIDASALASPSVALYVRVVNKDAAAATPTQPALANGEAKTGQKPGAAMFAWENVHFFDVKSADASQPRVLVSRALVAEAGDYDVFLAMKERATKKGSPAPKVTILKQPLTIPNFWTDDLTTSSVILAAKAEPLNSPLAPEQQMDNPYTLGTMRLTPSIDNKFSKAADLNVWFWVYNPAVDAAKKPDVSVEYAFHQKTGETEKYFNKTNPLRLNAQSLQPDFDLAAGHLLNGGQSIRLAPFPEGEYRLEIKVTDNLSKKTVSRDIRFTVST